MRAGRNSARRTEKRERGISATKVLCYHRVDSTHQLWSYSVRPSEMQEEREASVQLLKTFAPLDGLKRDNLAALAKKVSVRTLSAGRTLFKEGDTDKRTMAGRRHARYPRGRPHHRHDPWRHTRGPQPAVSETAAYRDRAGDGRDQLPVHRQ